MKEQFLQSGAAVRQPTLEEEDDLLPRSASFSLFISFSFGWREKQAALLVSSPCSTFTYGYGNPAEITKAHLEPGAA
jgi:hypothetical protein